jgi:hypothetical protein
MSRSSIANPNTDLSSFTSVPEIMFQILLSLNHKDLMNTRTINKDFNKVYRDDYFWKLKVEHDYGMVTEDKPPSITCRQQYLDLMTIKDPNKAAAKGRLDVLKWLAHTDAHLSQHSTNWVAANGRLKILKWLAETRNRYPEQIGVNWALMSNRSEVLKWVAETKGLYPDQETIVFAAMTGYLETLKWLAQMIDLRLDQDIVNEIASAGQLSVLKWLAETKKIYPNRRGADLAGTYNQSEVLKWLAANNIHPST